MSKIGWYFHLRKMTQNNYSIIDIVKDISSNNLELAPDNVVSERNAVCDSCDIQHRPTHMCTACGCFLPFKTRLLKTSCPLELW